MSTHLHYEARTSKNVRVGSKCETQAQAEASARWGVGQGFGGVHVVMVTTVVTEVEVYRPEAPARTPSSTEGVRA